MKRKILAALLLVVTATVVYAGLESGTYINSLVVTNPTGSDPFNTTDDHIRLLKATIKNTFPNLTGAMTADQTELNKLDGMTSSQAELNKLTGVTTTSAQFNYLNAASGTTGTGSIMFAASPTTTGTLTAATITAATVTASGNITASSFIGNATSATTARNISAKSGTSKTLSNVGPSGGVDGDIWYQY